jgi:anti-anti-sigma factor
MDGPADAVYVRRDEQTVTIRVQGRATMKPGAAVRRFADQCLAEGVTRVRVDLRPCTHMDSTFLGTLLYLKRMAERRPGGEFMLLSPSSACRGLLEQMGLADVLPQTAEEQPVDDTWAELSPETDDVRACKQHVVQAHQELANLPGPTGALFRAVTGCLKSDMETEEVKKG